LPGSGSDGRDFHAVRNDAARQMLRGNFQLWTALRLIAT
jgi:hypothetical protein